MGYEEELRVVKIVELSARLKPEGQHVLIRIEVNRNELSDTDHYTTFAFVKELHGRPEPSAQKSSESGDYEFWVEYAQQDWVVCQSVQEALDHSLKYLVARCDSLSQMVAKQFLDGD